MAPRKLRLEGLWPAWTRTDAESIPRHRRRLATTVPGLPPYSVARHVGAKSGRKRTSPLGYFTECDDVVSSSRLQAGTPATRPGSTDHDGQPRHTIQLGSSSATCCPRACQMSAIASVAPGGGWETYGGYGRRLPENTVPTG